MEKKPASGGMPAMARVATPKVRNVIGILRRIPPMRRMSCSPCRPWITLPAPRNSSALKNACVIRWNMAAMYAPRPAAANMNPSWLTVE